MAIVRHPIVMGSDKYVTISIKHPGVDAAIGILQERVEALGS